MTFVIDVNITLALPRADSQLSNAPVNLLADHIAYLSKAGTRLCRRRNRYFSWLRQPLAISAKMLFPLRGISGIMPKSADGFLRERVLRLRTDRTTGSQQRSE